MEIVFKNSRDESLFNSRERLQKKYGQPNADRIMQRMQELRAMPDLSAAAGMPQLRCHQLKGDRKRELAVDLIHPFRLIFTVAQNPEPVKDDGGLDWSRVYSIQIEKVEDYHGKRKKK